MLLKEQCRHDQSRLSTGHGIGALVPWLKMNTVTANYWHMQQQYDLITSVLFSVTEFFSLKLAL